jgi:hypothetical protein
MHIGKRRQKKTGRRLTPPLLGSETGETGRQGLCFSSFKGRGRHFPPESTNIFHDS